MSTLKEQMFHQFANESLRKLIKELKSQYEPKKEDRFSYQGITYEIGAAKIVNGCIQFEISSKIPQDELGKKMSLQEYFSSIQKEIERGKKKPYRVDRENIVREIGGTETKERDYVKCLYQYRENELYSEKELNARLQELKGKKLTQANLPDVPGITTVAGRLLLTLVREQLYAEAKQNIELLMEANEKIRARLRARK